MAVKERVAGFEVAVDCPKRMLNGPCGGVRDGMCEVEGECVWVRIYGKLKSEDRLDEFIRVRMPKVR